MRTVWGWIWQIGRPLLFEPLKVAAVGAASLAVYLAWPVSGWLMLALLLIWLLGHYCKGMLAKELRDTTIWIAVGLGVIDVVQLSLALMPLLVSEEQLRWWDDFVVAVRDALTPVLAFAYWWKILAVLALLLVVTPQLRLVLFLAKQRKVLSRTLLVLNTVCYFTFFSAMAVEHGGGRWLASRRQQALHNLKRIQEARQATVAAAWLGQQVKTMRPTEAPDLVRIAKPDAHLEWRVERAVEQLPALDDARGRAPREPLLTDMMDWTDSQSSYQPKLDDFHELAAEADRAEQVRADAETITAEALKGVIGDFLPHSDLVVRTFVKAMIAAMVKRSVRDAFPAGVTSFEKAKEWVQGRYDSASERPIAYSTIPDAPLKIPIPEFPMRAGLLARMADWAGRVSAWGSEENDEGEAGGERVRNGGRPGQAEPEVEFRPPAIRAIP